MSLKLYEENDVQRLADAIRTKNGKSDKYKLSEMPEAVENIQAGGVTGTGQYLVQVIDYDGTVLKSDHLNTGDTFTLPEAPTHDKLVFQGWSSPYDIVDNKVTADNQDITIGPMYTTASGLSEFDITLTKVTGLAVTFNMVGNKDWGDGTSDSETTHTYADYGNYTITCDGTELPEYMMGQGSSLGSENYTLTNIRLGSSVTSIGSNAFTRCSSLISVIIPNSVITLGGYVFSYCSSLLYITLPNSLTELKREIFKDCYSLKNIVIPNSVTGFGYYLFSRCYSLTNITVPNSLTGYFAFGTYTFQQCYSLTNITIPNNITSIQNDTFYNCCSLTELTIPSGVTSIGNTAFRYCYSITKYDFSTATVVPALSTTNAFEGINKICKIIVPDALYDEWIAATNWTTYADYIYKVSEVYPPEPTPANYFNISNGTINGFSTQGKALYDAGELTDLVLPSSYSLDENGSVIDGKDYDVTTIANAAFNNCNNIISIIIPSSITSIYSNAFRNCSGLTSITIPSSITKIGFADFYGCSSLTKITIPSSVTIIDGWAFHSCSNLINIVIPSGVTDIGEYAFYRCAKLTEIKVLATTPPSLQNTNAISSATTTIYIPAGTLSAYQTATNWSSFASKFVELSE